jgi:hypothetical protein
MFETLASEAYMASGFIVSRPEPAQKIENLAWRSAAFQRSRSQR